MNRRITNNHFHRYLNPERDSEEAALRVHGLTAEFLGDKPKFREVAREFVDFISGAELILHNAAFDIAFIDHELSLLDLAPVMHCCSGIVDTLKLAREMHRESAMPWIRCANATRSTTRRAPFTVRFSMRAFLPRFIWR